MAGADGARCPTCGETYVVRKPPGSRQQSLCAAVACVGPDGLYLHERAENDR